MDDQTTIRCLYSCHVCKLEKIAIDVPARGIEDVREWMDMTVRHVANDHRRRSPRCTATSLSDLMIPLAGSDKIGGPSKN